MRNIIFLLFFLPYWLFAQEETNDKYQWTLYGEESGVQIYYKYQECNKPTDGIFKEYVLLQFLNTSEASIAISWDNELWYNNVCQTCKSENGEYHYEINLGPGESIEGDCNDNYDLRLFSKFLNYRDKATLTKFDLKNLTVTQK